LGVLEGVLALVQSKPLLGTADLLGGTHAMLLLLFWRTSNIPLIRAAEGFAKHRLKTQNTDNILPPHESFDHNSRTCILFLPSELLTIKPSQNLLIGGLAR
jgi:hypothetical protein